MKINKKIIKAIISILILIMVGMILTNTVLAWDMTGTLGELENKHAENAEGKVTDIMGAVVNLISTIGAGVAIIMLVAIGIKYVTAGSEGKADAKKDLTGYVFGAVILFGISGILKIMQMFIDANINNV